MGSKAPLGRRERDTDLMKTLKSLDKVKFAGAPFWDGQPPGDWRLSRVVTEANDTFGWRDNDDLHPMAAEAKNDIAARLLVHVQEDAFASPRINEALRRAALSEHAVVIGPHSICPSLAFWP